MALRVAGLIAVGLFLLQFLQHGVRADILSATLFPYGAQLGDNEFKDVSIADEIKLPSNISFLDHRYDTLIVSADGTVAFGNKEVEYEDGVTYFGGVRNPSIDVPFIAPLLYRSYRPRFIAPAEYQGKIYHRVVDNRSGSTALRQEDLDLIRQLNQYLPGTVVHAPETLDVKFLIVITWENVAEGPELATTNECRKSNPCNSTTFQLALAGSDSYTFAVFNYDKYEISGNPQYEAGINAGKGRGWYNVLPCHGSQGCATDPATTISSLPHLQGSDVTGRYIFSVAQEAVIRGGCLAKELTQGILEVFPRAVGMFGGEKLEVSGVCGVPGSVIYCRFGSAADPFSQTINGTLVNSMKGYCPVPPLATTGHLDLFVLDVNKSRTSYHSINVVLPSRLEDPVAIDMAVRTQWYQKDAREITVKWDSSKFSKDGSVSVDIKLIGYKEDEKTVEYKELKTFGQARSRDNSYTIQTESHQCDTDCEQFEIGLLEVSLPARYHATALERVAVRFGPIPLGWYVNQNLESRRGSDWSDQKCREWHAADSKDTSWIQDLSPCPCTLDQALADFGRWQTDPGCNLFTGSQCTFHKGAKHCVRSVSATAKDGAGNQCCYNSDGTLKHSQLSFQGSTPDRSHVWGVYPYNSPNRVPELSHWKHDVASFFYCCLWNKYELCDLYMQLRPTSDCRNYDVPGIGFIHGQIHINTFDGFSYNLASAGDFILAQYQDVSLAIHGKFEPRANSWDLGKKTLTSSWQPRALTGIAISGGRQKIEVSLGLAETQERRALDIRVDGDVQYFSEKSSFRQDFQDCAIVNNAASVKDNRNDNFTILLTRLNVGVTVAALNGLLHVTMGVPPNFKPEPRQNPQVVGLLGAFDGRADNDLFNRSGVTLPPVTSKKDIFERFILSWRLVASDYKIFRFHNEAEQLDPQHSYFEYSQIPTNFTGAPSAYRVSQVCGNSDNCKWDFQITSEEPVARATRDADDWLRNLQRSASLVDTCGLPELGSQVELTTEDFSPGAQVRVSSCKNGESLDSEVQFSCIKESLEEARRHNRADYGTRRIHVANGEEYIVHWDPQPYVLCSGNAEEADNLALIIGVAVGGVVLFIIIVVVVIVVLRKRKSASSSPKEKTPSDRRKKQAETDPGSAEAMLSRVEERSPVYKPSKEPVRMSDIQGSNV